MGVAGVTNEERTQINALIESAHGGAARDQREWGGLALMAQDAQASAEHWRGAWRRARERSDRWKALAYGSMVMAFCALVVAVAEVAYGSR